MRVTSNDQRSQSETPPISAVYVVVGSGAAASVISTVARGVRPGALPTRIDVMSALAGCQSPRGSVTVVPGRGERVAVAPPSVRIASVVPSSGSVVTTSDAAARGTCGGG